MLVAWVLDKSIIMWEISKYSYHNSAKNNTNTNTNTNTNNNNNNNNNKIFI